MAQPEIHYQLARPARWRRVHPNSARDRKPLFAERPHITRLMALAIKFEVLLDEVGGLSYTEPARLASVSRSRITQILNLLHLAPDLQEQLLFLEPNAAGRDVIHESALRGLTQVNDWQEQRRLFDALVESDRTKLEGGTHA